MCVQTYMQNLPGSTCHQCALRLHAQNAWYAESLDACPDCAENDFNFSRSIALMDYTLPTLPLIHGIKNGDLYLLRILARHLADKITHMYAESASLPDAISYVPLSTQRLYQRGYNQSLYLGKQLARMLGIPCLHLFKTDKNSAQKTLLKHERENTAQFYHALPQAPWQNVQTLALVDDVMTSGATLSALSAIARMHGVRDCHAWVLARTTVA